MTLFVKFPLYYLYDYDCLKNYKKLYISFYAQQSNLEAKI